MFPRLSLKTIVVILILLFLIAGIVLVYIFFFAENAQNGQKSFKTIKIEPKVKAMPIPLSQEKALAPTVDPTGRKIKYYSKKNGNIYEVNFDGTDLARASSAELANILQILWSPNKSKVVGTFQEGENIKKYLHNYSLGQSVLLNEKIKQVAWSPDDTKIAAYSYDSESRAGTISIANVDGSEFKNIFQTRVKDIDLEWPTIDKISLKTKASGLAEGIVLVINPSSGEFRSVLTGIYGLNAKWFPLGNKILYSTTDANGGELQLFIADQKGENKKETGLATLIEKCAFSQDNRTLICALPQKITENAVWPDDYYKGAVTTQDSFWKINLDTGEKIPLFVSESTDKIYDAMGLFLSPEEDYLFFINKKDGLLYGLKIE